MDISIGGKKISVIVTNGQTILNARGIPTSKCVVCESELFTIQATFDELYEISSYLLDAQCAYCGTLLTAPTPLDLVEEA